MSSVLLNLDTAVYQDLVDDARTSIPSLAQGWTDYNISDPGIMLIELLAWTTEAQIYSLGHVRRDERAAYSALMGVRARGPQPASGLIWPQLPAGTPTPWGGGMALPAQTHVHAQRGNLPDLFVSRSIWLHGASLTSVIVRTHAGPLLDYTPINQRRGGSFPTFGPTPHTGDRLLLGLSKFPVPYPSPSGAQLVAIGFRIRNPAEGLTARTVASARFRATLQTGGIERAVTIRADSTLGLAQTGVMLIEWLADALTSGEAATLCLELIEGELYPAPLAERIDLNVLSVVQQQQQVDPFPMGAPSPDANLPLKNPGVCFGGDDPPVAVSIRSGTALPVAWTLVDTLDFAGPADTVYLFDPVAGAVQFGNGINGAIPPGGSQVSVSYRTSNGAGSNVAGGLHWLVQGALYGSNLDPVSGGIDAEQLTDLQGRSRAALAVRPIVTDNDLLVAAKGLTGLRVVRAEIAPAGASPSSVRTLVALRDRDITAGATGTPETHQWLTAVRRALSAQLTLGQRLRVIGPQYVPVNLQASVTVGSVTNSTPIVNQILEVLAARFAAIASDQSTTPWPLGSAVAVQSVRGWLRAVPGVLAVTDLQLASGNTTLTSGALTLPTTGLPQLTVAASDITITRTATGSRR
jgi:hypothetical protein